jgi:hypothetical protein
MSVAEARISEDIDDPWRYLVTAARQETTLG